MTFLGQREICCKMISLGLTSTWICQQSNLGPHIPWITLIYPGLRRGEWVVRYNMSLLLNFRKTTVNNIISPSIQIMNLIKIHLVPFSSGPRILAVMSSTRMPCSNAWSRSTSSRGSSLWTLMTSHLSQMQTVCDKNMSSCQHSYWPKTMLFSK